MVRNLVAMWSLNCVKNYIKLMIVFFIMAASSDGRCESDEIKSFLKKCGIGTLTGATLGLLSVAVSDRPNENMGNIARGASLGLYGGILYGLIDKANYDRSIAPSAEVSHSTRVYFSPIVQADRGGFILVTLF